MEKVSTSLLIWGGCFFLLGTMSYIAIFFAVLWAFFTKRIKGFRIWLFLFGISVVIYFPVSLLIPVELDSLSLPNVPEPANRLRMESLFTTGVFFLYSLPLLLPVRFYKKKKLRMVAYCFIGAGFLFSILGVYIRVAIIETTGFSVYGFLRYTMFVSLIPLAFLFFLHLQKKAGFDSKKSQPESSPQTSQPPQSKADSTEKQGDLP